MSHAELRPKARRLLLHVLDQLRTLNALRPARKILDQRRDRKLAARLMPFNHQRFQVGARGVNRRSQPSAAGAKNNGVANRVCHGGRFDCTC